MVDSVTPQRVLCKTVEDPPRPCALKGHVLALLIPTLHIHNLTYKIVRFMYHLHVN
jgi:hypothetical protein